MALHASVNALASFQGRAPQPDPGRATFQVKPDFLFHLQQTGNQPKLDEGWFVPDVLDDPAGIWVDRLGQEETLCYAGVPSGRFAEYYGQDVSPQADRVFTVIVTPDLVACDWAWVEVAADGSGFPEGHEQFGRRVIP